MLTIPVAELPERVDAVPEPARAGRTRLGVVALFAVLVVAAAHRLRLVLSTDFPINDGGLFVAYVEATQRSFPGLPATITYNGLDIPNAYPPLGFWLGGLLGKLGIGAIDVLHIMPAVVNVAWLALVALLFLRDGASRLLAAVALAVIALAPRSYEWLVMGGGLTRGLGSLFLVLTLIALGGTRRGDPRPLSLRSAALAGACVAGALLSHLEWGILTAAAVVLQRALCSRGLRPFLVTTAMVAGTAVVLVAPWVLTVISWHGPEPFLNASGTSSWYLPDTVLRLEGFARLQWPNLLMAVGGIVLLARRQPFWPLFIVLCIVLTPRHALTPLVLPIGYLTASGLEAVLSTLRRVGSQWRGAPEVAVVAGLALVTLLPSLQAVDRSRFISPDFRALSQDERAAMSWVRTEHTGSSFAVVTAPHWAYDGTAEWFPVLTGATSTTTVQGTEWLPDDAFLQRERDVLAMKASPSCEELLQRMAGFGPVQFVWVQMRFECFETAGLRRVYDNPTVSIFAAG